MSEEIKCPFCKIDNDGFDKIGLKDHLLYRCQEFEETISVIEESALRKEAKAPQAKDGDL